jgi:hypothetical protein
MKNADAVMSSQRTGLLSDESATAIVLPSQPSGTLQV